MAEIPRTHGRTAQQLYDAHFLLVTELFTDHFRRRLFVHLARWFVADEDSDNPYEKYDFLMRGEVDPLRKEQYRAATLRVLYLIAKIPVLQVAIDCLQEEEKDSEEVQGMFIQA